MKMIYHFIEAHKTMTSSRNKLFLMSANEDA